MVLKRKHSNHFSVLFISVFSLFVLPVAILSADSSVSPCPYTWEQTGTAGGGDIKNIRTVVNGASYPTEVSGKKYTAVFDPPVLIRKGYYADVHIEGDIGTTGSTRTVKFDIRQSGDISLLGKSFGYYVLIYPESGTAESGNSVFITSDGTTDGNEGNPFFSGSVVTINPGAFTSIGK